MAFITTSNFPVSQLPTPLSDLEKITKLADPKGPQVFSYPCFDQPPTLLSPQVANGSRIAQGQHQTVYGGQIKAIIEIRVHPG